MAFDVQRALDGFVTHGGTPTGTLDFYSRLSNPTHVIKSIIYITQTVVGDSFVVRLLPLLIRQCRLSMLYVLADISLVYRLESGMAGAGFACQPPAWNGE